MRRKIGIIITLMLLSAIICHGQEISDYEISHRDLKSDSMPVISNQYKEIGISALNKMESGYFLRPEFSNRPELTRRNKSSYLNSNCFYGDMPAPGTAFIPTWKNGGCLATGSISSYPGLMEIHKGSFGFVQNFGNLSIYAGGEAVKYGFFNGLHTQYGINGTIEYRFSPKIAITGYATYYFGRPPMMPNGLPMPTAMMGQFGVNSYGATVDYQFNETFGLIVGGEAVQQFGTNHYRFEPIVTPTISIGRVRIGLPVGQILNDYIRSRIERKRNSR